MSTHQCRSPLGEGTDVSPICGSGGGFLSCGVLASSTFCLAISLAARCLMYSRSMSRSCTREEASFSHLVKDAKLRIQLPARLPYWYC